MKKTYHHCRHGRVIVVVISQYFPILVLGATFKFIDVVVGDGGGCTRTYLAVNRY